MHKARPARQNSMTARAPKRLAHRPAGIASSALTAIGAASSTPNWTLDSASWALTCTPATANSVQQPAATTKPASANGNTTRSEEHTSELQSRPHLVCRLLLE